MKEKVYVSLSIDKELFMKAVNKFLAEKGEVLKNKDLIEFDEELKGINSKSRRSFLFHYLLKKYVDSEF